jgi:hypothetical protein
MQIADILVCILYVLAPLELHAPFQRIYNELEKLGR